MAIIDENGNFSRHRTGIGDDLDAPSLKCVEKGCSLVIRKMGIAIEISLVLACLPFSIIDYSFIIVIDRRSSPYLWRLRKRQISQPLLPFFGIALHFL